MAKIKTSNIQARADDGTINIGHHYTDPDTGMEVGNPDHSTIFWGHVEIPEYASKEWVVDEILNGDGSGESIRNYVHRDRDANEVDGYARLNAHANVDFDQMKQTINDSHMMANATGNGLYSHKQIDDKLDQLREDLDDLEEKAAQAIIYEVGPIGSQTPAKGTFSPDVEAYADITTIVAHKTDKEDSDHDFGHVNIGDSLEITEDDDHYGRYTVDSINIADPYCTFGVTAVSSRGDAITGDTAYIDVLPSVDTRDFYKLDGSRRLKGENATIRWDADDRPDDLTNKSAIDATGMKIRATRFDVPHGGGFYSNNAYRMTFNSSNTTLGYSGSAKLTIGSGVQTLGSSFTVYGRKSSTNYGTGQGSLGNLIEVTNQPSGAAGYARYYGSISNNNDIATKKYVLDNKVSGYVNTTGNQTGLAGNKTWTGAHTFSNTAAVIRNGSTSTKGCFYQYNGNLYYNPH
jgi:hypothetical protein